MRLQRRIWGTIADQNVDLFTISDEKTGIEVSISNLGASLINVKTPDRHGTLGNIHLGRECPAEFFDDEAHYGSTMGRCTSVISFGRFELEGKTYELSKNQMKVHNFHGGYSGFSRKLWVLRDIRESPEEISLVLAYVSADGEEGFPGNLRVELTYIISPMSICWSYSATTDKATVVNLTNHAYWNLDGPGKTVDGHSIQVFASRFQHVRMGEMIRKTLASLFHLPPQNKTPPIEVRPVEAKGPDLREVRKFAEIFKTHGDLDTVYLLDHQYSSTVDSELPTVAQLYSETSGRSLEMKSSEPALIVYSGNSMKGTTIMGKDAIKHGAVCLEPIRPLDAINLPKFRRSVILLPGETYAHKTRLIFGIN